VRRALFAALAGAALLAGTSVAAPKPGPYRPKIEPRDFTARVDNPWFPLAPGMSWHYTERQGATTRDEFVSVLRRTRKVMGVECAVVHDMVMENGQTIEETYDWYAQDKRGNVWYFGEETTDLRRGAPDPAGSWEAGIDRALPGLLMPARPKRGKPYRQEYAPGRAEDMGEVAALGDSVRVPAGAYAGCVRTRGWSPLEPGATERKWYASGIGLVRSESSDGEVTELISTGHR
jgi:hypothetical protein